MSFKTIHKVESYGKTQLLFEFEDGYLITHNGQFNGLPMSIEKISEKEARKLINVQVKLEAPGNHRPMSKIMAENEDLKKENERIKKAMEYWRDYAEKLQKGLI